jgi:hypothetical protein
MCIENTENYRAFFIYPITLVNNTEVKMSNFYTTFEPEWETNDQGWHAVVSPSFNDGQWVAYVEASTSSPYRIWSRTSFAAIEEAQNWCKHEIDHQHKHSTETGQGSWMWGNVEVMHNNEFMAY